MNISRKRILIFHLNMSFGGVETQLLSLLTGLNPAKYDIHLALVRRQGELLDRVPRYVTVHELNCPVSGMINPALVLQIKRAIVQLRPDIVFSFHAVLHAGTWLGASLSNRAVPVLGSIPGLISPGRLDFIRKRVYRRMTWLVCVSRCVATSLTQTYGCRENVTVIRNCTDIQGVTHLSQQSVRHPWLDHRSGPVLVTVGRLIASKGIDFLIRAIADLRRDVDARLLIIGDGPENENLQRLAARINVADPVDFLGFKNNPHPYVRQSDIFAFASLYEGLPTVLIDAMICQVPVVSTAFAGVEDIFENGKNGIVVQNRLERQFSEAVCSLWRSNEARRRMAAQAYDMASRAFSKDRYIQAYESLFDQLTEKTI